MSEKRKEMSEKSKEMREKRRESKERETPRPLSFLRSPVRPLVKFPLP